MPFYTVEFETALPQPENDYLLIESEERTTRPNETIRDLIVDICVKHYVDVVLVTLNKYNNEENIFPLNKENLDKAVEGVLNIEDDEPQNTITLTVKRSDAAKVERLKELSAAVSKAEDDLKAAKTELNDSVAKMLNAGVAKRNGGKRKTRRRK